ncbi:MAG: glycosyl hydrolase family 8 [Bacteroidia bacterium]|nr:glycosyl hydrolase family 8 [Bacteroidia bacterium]
MKRIITISLILALSLSYSACGQKAEKKKSPKATTSQKVKGKGAYYTGKYRNLFLENGHSLQEIRAKNETAFQQLFHGDSASQAIYFDAGRNVNGPMAYVSDVLHNDVRSEGISYGLMIAVQMDKKAEFDAIWNWAMNYMYISKPEHPSEGYFAWSLERDGTPNAETAAPDGEEYMVMSLYFASNRWGDGKGIYDYKAWADKILTAMRHHPIKRGKTKFGLRVVGPMVEEDKFMIRFVPDSGSWNFSDPSYHLPAFYDLWALWGPEADREFWVKAATTSRDFFLKTTNPKTGLAPDYANFDGTPHTTRSNQRSGNFSFDARRTQMNWAVDWAWWRKDQREVELSNRLQSFFASEGVDTYGMEYSLEGKKLNPGHAKGLVATNAVVSLAADHALSKDFCEALWNTPVPSEFNERYYDGLLYLMGMLHCSGEFKIWGPSDAGRR